MRDLKANSECNSPPVPPSLPSATARPHAHHVALLRLRAVSGAEMRALYASDPMMLTLPQCKSESDFIKVGECPLDPGGYFIIKVRPVLGWRSCEGSAADSPFPGHREGHYVAGAAEQKQNHY